MAPPTAPVFNRGSEGKDAKSAAPIGQTSRPLKWTSKACAPLQAAARCEQACFGGRVYGQDLCLHTLFKHCLSDVPPDRFSLAMYPLGGFAEAPLSSYLSDDFLLISLPRGLKTLVDVPFLSFGCDFLEIFGGQKMAPERLF